MKQLGMLALAIALAAAAWWWFTAEMPRRQHERAAAAEAAAIQAERANTLYRWRDDAGNLHVTEDPPKGRRYERISRAPKDGIEVHGGRG
ncbi:DUF4124 domain-containing protein [Thermomonas brevis]|jgi:hypothetical protein|uniref:DUF4124 domain-containing protein n=1 Tax=Thermomonas brevis TaxID=215691 RepID=A0A7G9QWU5_9GAMM|nr:DUF4124 domain-containing protein [Thermomonas brevis]QNN47820.1 DUF4124 domain-containing protein [Thermomonas brevis]